MNMPVYKVTGRKRLSQLLKWESNSEFCRQPYTLLAGSGSERKLLIGTLVAMVFGAGAVGAAAAADVGNTGDGILTLADPAVTAAAKPGDYTIVCTTGGADATSKFRVEDPEGVQVGTATGGTAFAKHIRFTIAGGAANFVEGDKFTVTVTADVGDPANKIVAWDPDADDGTERIWGVGINDVTAPDGEDAIGGLALRRDAILFAGAIEWPDGVTADQKEAAIVELEALRILVR